MTFQTVPVNIAGPSYQDRSRPLAVQQTKNFYHEYVKSGKEQVVIKSFPGQTEFGSSFAANERGAHVANETLYRVLGGTLYSVSAVGVHTSLGSIPGSDRCIFADDGDNIFIVSNSVVYQYSISGGTLTTVTDANISGSQSVTFINNQFIYTKPSLSIVSDVGDGSSASGLNAVGAEANPDEIVRDYVFDQIIYRFGKRTTECWDNPGIGSPPIERITGLIFNVGLAGLHAVTASNQYIYWLGSDLSVWRARRGDDQKISTTAISSALRGYSTVADAFANHIILDGKSYIAFSFPTANKTWVVNEDFGEDGWFELSTGVTDGISNISSSVDCYNKPLVTDRTNGKIYQLDFDTYDIDGSLWQRRRTMGSINSDLLGQKGKRVKMSRFELILETGTGLITGQGEDPKIMLEASYDGGRSWTEGTWMKIGRLGETNAKAEWFNMKSFYDLIIRITVTDPVAVNIYSGAIDLKLAGR